MFQARGVLKVWKEDRGFGFIKSAGGPDVFVHIRDFGRIARSPRVGDVVLYQPVQDANGRLRAGDVHIEGVPRSTATRARRNARGQEVRLGSVAGAVAVLLVVVALGMSGYEWTRNKLDEKAAQLFPPSGVQSTKSPKSADRSDQLLAQAFRNRQSNLQVESAGNVIRLLPDDDEGRRHQRFILELGSGQTLLVAHNIDLAARIPSLQEGDSVAFYGEYEWNSKGGVIHWTHEDPKGRHVGGWLRHNGRTYQ